MQKATKYFIANFKLVNGSLKSRYYEGFVKGEHYWSKFSESAYLFDSKSDAEKFMIFMDWEYQVYPAPSV